MNGNRNSGVLTEIYRSSAPYSNGLRCGGGACPAVYAKADGSFVVVGRRLTAEEKASVLMDAIEDALEIPADLVQGIARKFQS